MQKMKTVFLILFLCSTQSYACHWSRQGSPLDNGRSSASLYERSHTPLLVGGPGCVEATVKDVIPYAVLKTEKKDAASLDETASINKPVRPTVVLCTVWKKEQDHHYVGRCSPAENSLLMRRSSTN